MNATPQCRWTVRHTVAAVSFLCAGLVQAQTLKMSWQLSAVAGNGAVTSPLAQPPMGLMEAYELALNKDLTYAATLAAFRAVEEQIPQAQAGLRPQVSLAGSMGASTSRPRTQTTSSDVAYNQLDALTTTQSTTDTRVNSAAQQAGFPQFDTATATNSQSTTSTTLNEQTQDRLSTQGWQSSSQATYGRSANAELNVRWPLYRPANDRQLEQSRLNVAQAQVRLQAARQDVAVRLCQAYFDVTLGQENLRALDAEMGAVAAQLQVAEQSFKGGETTIADVKDAQAKWDIVQAQKLAQRNALQVRLASLQGLIGQRAAAAQKLKVETLLDSPPALGALADWLARSAQQSYPVLADALALAAAEKEVAKQEASFKPSLDFVASLSAGRNLQRERSETNAASSSVSERNEPSQTTAESQSTASSVRNGDSAAGTSQSSSAVNVQSSSVESSQSTSNRPSSNSRSSSTQFDAYVGVRLNIPLYDGGLGSSKVREAVARKEQKALELQRTRSDAALATETAFLDAQGLFAQAAALRAAEQSSQVALKSNQMGYQAGVRINADILNAQQQVFAVRRDLIKAQISALLATLKLKAAVGELVDEDVRRLAQWLQ